MISGLPLIYLSLYYRNLSTLTLRLCTYASQSLVHTPTWAKNSNTTFKHLNQISVDLFCRQNLSIIIFFSDFHPDNFYSPKQPHPYRHDKRCGHTDTICVIFLELREFSTRPSLSDPGLLLLAWIIAAICYATRPTKNTLIVSKSDLKINLVQFPNQNFFKTIRNKLYWGLDKRN